MIIDAYSHMFHSTYIERLTEIGGTWVAKKVAEARNLVRRKSQVIDVGQRLEQLARNNIDFQVVTPPHNL